MSQARQAGAYPGFCSMKQLGVFLLPISPALSSTVPIYTPDWSTVRINCLAQEHNTMSPARAWTQTVWSGDERTNYEATAPPLRPRNGLDHYPYIMFLGKALYYTMIDSKMTARSRQDKD